jgi:hypothetical protein
MKPGLSSWRRGNTGHDLVSFWYHPTAADFLLGSQGTSRSFVIALDPGRRAVHRDGINLHQ